MSKGDIIGIWRFNRGLSYRDRGDLTRAIEDFSAALTVLSKFADPYAKRGDIYYMMGDFEKAAADQDRAATLESIENRPRRHSAKAINLFLLGRKAEAKAAYETARGLIAPEYAYNLANKVCWEGTLSGGAALVDAACEETERVARTLDTRSRANLLDTVALYRLEIGDRAAAQRLLAEALRFDPERFRDVAARFGEFLVLRIQRELQLAGNWPGKLDDGDMTPETEAAIRTYQQSAKLTEDGKPSRELLAHLQLAQGRN